MSTLATLQDILVKDYRVPSERVTPDAELTAMGLDSLSVLELMFKIEDYFHVKIVDDTPTNLQTVQDVVDFINGLLAQKKEAPLSA
jgi:acyl carrier protein